MNAENKPNVRGETDKTYTREDVPEYLLEHGCSLRTQQELEENRRYVMELLKRSEDEIRRRRYEHL